VSSKAVRRQLIREAIVPLSAVLLILLAGSATYSYFRRHSIAAAIRMSFLPPAGSVIKAFAVSPDGRYVTFTANSQGKFVLWLRTIDSLTPQLLPGTDGAAYPFWSPDGRSIAFFTPGKLKRIEIPGGPAQTICDAADGRGGSWNSDDVIVFAGGPNGPLFQVKAGGGLPAPVTRIDPANHETAHLFPQFLPDGHRFLYLAAGAGMGEPAVRAGSLDSMESHFIARADAPAVYIAPAQGALGSLLFGDRGALISQAFDVQTLQLRGDRTLVAPASPHTFGWLNAAVSASGTLAYRGATGKERQITWYDRTGKALETIGKRNSYYAWNLSPDQTRLAMADQEPAFEAAPLWTMDLAKGSPSRLTMTVGRMFYPVWSPDGTGILFSRENGEGMSIERHALNGNSLIPLLKSSGPMFPTDWSADGRFVTYFTASPDLTQLKLWVAAVPANGVEPKPRALSPATANETSGAFSPTVSKEGPRWIAYTSDESGRPEIYVKNFPAGDHKWKISTHGGWMPHWRQDGQELFYLAMGGSLMAVEIAESPDFTVGVPNELFRTTIPPPDYPDVPVNEYAVSHDGQRFLVNDVVDATGVKPITILTHWNPAARK
jgi:eukaryotic-like serine/threonine-protein kinase